MNDFNRKLLIKYTVEFVVIVLGISVTFWIDEWNRNRLEKIQHIKDLSSIIDDLENDSLTINRVNEALLLGDYKTNSMINLIELMQQDKISYRTYYDSIINMGFLYTYQTFFMTDAECNIPILIAFGLISLAE